MVEYDGLLMLVYSDILIGLLSSYACFTKNSSNHVLVYEMDIVILHIYAWVFVYQNGLDSEVLIYKIHWDQQAIPIPTFGSALM